MGRIVVFIIAAIVLTTAPVSAIPSEGPSLPDAQAAIWGFQANHISQRDFNKVEGSGRTTQYFLQASYGVTSRFCLDGKIGMGTISFRRADGLDLDFPAGFCGGYGFRWLMYDDAPSGVRSVFGFQHISCHPFKDTVNDVNHRVIWDEWHGSWLWALTPSDQPYTVYAGPQYSATQLKYREADLRRRLKAEDRWGAVAGIEYRFKDRFIGTKFTAGVGNGFPVELVQGKCLCVEVFRFRRRRAQSGTGQRIYIGVVGQRG